MGKDSLTKSTTKKKASTKKKKTAVAKTTAKKAKAAAPTLRDLLHKKFDRVVPGSLYQPPAAAARPDVASPPFFEADDPEDVKRVRALLFKKYNLAELAAAAKAEEEARKKAEAEAKAKAEEEARKKAEAEAKAKAEEEARKKAEAEAKAKAEEEA
ncbi:MAG TPA: protein TolA, partial [Desulfobacteraceae bacterium]|nr:protein TolA [Desulfobacteraceae bacterium]